MNFPSIDTIGQFADSEYEKDFIISEYQYGLLNYLNRLDRLMFEGSYVLDAGCGVGQWSLALANRYKKVTAVDLKPERLKVLEQVSCLMAIKNIDIHQGSIETLPYEDQSFNAVFCYGVIMFTEIEKTLREFFRVLRPGGRVYLCLNGDGWSRYLIQERGKNDRNVQEAGRKTLYDTYWGRAIKAGVLEDLNKDFALAVSINPDIANNFDDDLCLKILINRQIGQKLWNYVTSDCGEPFQIKLVQDVRSICTGKIQYPDLQPTRAYMPGEIEELVTKIGFAGFQWAPETGLVCNWLLPSCEPKYAGYYGQDLSVWECMFSKPELMNVDNEFFIERARKASREVVYLESCQKPIVSNRSLDTFPLVYLERAERLAQRLGGEKLLEKLAQQLVYKCSNEDEAIRSIITFVQKAIFRDPVSQPVNPDGSLPENIITLLCSRGRCGHVSSLIVDLCRCAGFEARVTQLPHHIIAEVKVNGKWVIADADFFKNGIIPINHQGELLPLEEIRENPYQLDRFPPTGLFIRPASNYTKGVFGSQVTGYVDALGPQDRGFVSGYYVPEAWGWGASIPVISSFRLLSLTKFFFGDPKVQLKWKPSFAREGNVLGYRIYVGSNSRGWDYSNLIQADRFNSEIPCDILKTKTSKTKINFRVPTGVKRIYASIVAYTDRIEREPDTYFLPSEEAVCEL